MSELSKMSQFNTVRLGAELGILLSKQRGKFVTVHFGIHEHMLDFDDEAHSKKVEDTDQPWVGTVDDDDDLDNFLEHFDRMATLVFEECHKRSFYFEGTAIEKEGFNKINIWLKWGS